MSFSSRMKEDLVRVRVKAERQRKSQLSGLTLTCGALHVGREGTGVSFVTESLAVAREVVSLSEGLYALASAVTMTEQQRRRNPLVTVTLTGEDAERLLCDTGMLVRLDDALTLGDGVPERLIGDDEDARAFLRGAFLGSGSCLNPARGYHLELVMRTQRVAEDCIALMARFTIAAKRHARKDKQIVYLKGEGVADFLALIGASAAAMAFANVRAEREMRNYINRASNCETANIGKTVDAGLMQIQAIEKIERARGLDRLPMPLYEAAMLRLNHPDATLQELADMAEIGKSGMNHRFSRLLRLAGEIEYD